MRKVKLQAQFQLLWAIRQFFSRQGFLDVMPPPMVQNPGMETHIHPFQVGHANTLRFSPWYLNTSPEFHMKELLSMGFEDIFTIGYAFRDEPYASNHRPQFLMLEWYRTKAHYTKIMDDCEELFKFSLNSLNEKNLPVDQDLLKTNFQRATIQEIFSDMLNVDILNFLDKKDLKELIEKDFKDVPLPTMGEELSWDDYYFLLFLNKIEPHLAHYPYLLLYEFPNHLSALSTLKESDPRVCERFEIYAKGVELCNCFNELRDLKIQKERFAFQVEEKEKLYGYKLPEPTVLYNALEKGLPESSGIALGVERLLKVLTGIENPFWD
ncbi:amino acid--tRNA ligase-related protein [Bacteriovorax sp. PP10]|uniref:Amino acid--tRNA ligase-related protein n=1 Tax=Bacteriovorax antarcticus TaxID=3088717 RepID=A0ABU5VPQ9_9BACT|nr:amino acid--tRNA ligase-related protein [Bacteriovorax sp. PP10]MEA9355031.1 amino acid--tRNA ligase-related protein [Bacteriovorax sp. PP10]